MTKLDQNATLIKIVASDGNDTDDYCYGSQKISK